MDRPLDARRPAILIPRVADRRGLTLVGAVLVALAAGLVGGTVDVLTGSGLRLIFAIFFVSGCVIAAVTVHLEDLLGVAIMPPLLYVTIALLAGGVGSAVGSGSWLVQQSYELVASLITGFPTLALATAGAFLVAVIRARAGRVATGAAPIRQPARVR